MGQAVFFEIEDWEKEHIQNSESKLNSIFTKNKAHEETDPSLFHSEIISTFIYSELNSQTLTKFPNLKLIATRSTGYDHIDLNYCQQKGITVVNVPTYGAHAVA
ncbi:MAG TPA: hypothetical protein VLG50_01480, partial [Candidatus Saccharimonadales bacterium]|nr:hypothetical protein [Candidatus Saccharimonadales bacterium]